MEKQERAYQAKEAADKIGIASSTLRKWCQALEVGGYRFIKDQQQRRIFTDYDIEMLIQFHDLTQKRNVGSDTAIELVVAKFQRAATRDVALPDMPQKSPDEERHDEVIERLEKQDEDNVAIRERLEQQEAFNKALLERLDKQQKFIEESVIKRDQQLLAAIQEVQERQLLIAAASEEKKKRGFWSRLFGSGE